MTGSDNYRNQSSAAGSRSRAQARDRQSIADISGLLKSLPQRTPPVDLKIRLKVLASREASRRRTVPQGSFAALWFHFNQWFSELMRPIAIPTAGGFFSALLLFGVLSPSLFVRGAVTRSADTPTVLYMVPSVKSSLPLEYEGEAMLVEVVLDEEGRLVEYSVPEGHVASQEARRSLENHLLTMVFNPAVVFGQPTASKLKIWLRSNRIDIRG
jgi:hypothetical protein